jgi:hypothetical protein
MCIFPVGPTVEWRSASDCGALDSLRIHRLSDRPSAWDRRLVLCPSSASCRRPGITVLTALLFGLAPSWQAARVSLVEAMNIGGRGSSDRAGRVRQALVVVEPSAALVRSLSTLLFGVPPLDPVTFVVAPLTLTVVALLACLAPAVRALSTDPVAALRAE